MKLPVGEGDSFNLLPHAGEMDGMAYTPGYAGHGLAMATHLGKTAAEAMLAGRLREHLFASFPFPEAPLGLYNGKAWFLPLAGLWYRFLDWIE